MATTEITAEDREISFERRLVWAEDTLYSTLYPVEEDDTLLFLTDY